MTTLDLITREDLEKFKTELFAELRTMQPAAAEQSAKRKWLRSAEVRERLNISPGNLQNLRISGQLRFSKVGSMTFYKSEDIEKLLDNNLH